MLRNSIRWTLVYLVLGGTTSYLRAQPAQPAEDFLRTLPADVMLVSSDVVSRAQTAAISQKLGGKIERLTNSVLSIHGRRIQVNAITAPDQKNAAKIHEALKKFKPFPYCFRRGNLVIEYVDRSLDEAIATKTSYELSFRKKPPQVRYRVTADLALVDKADYMSCNPLFNQLLIWQRTQEEAAEQKIDQLKRKFKFGNLLNLRHPKFSNPQAVYRLEPSWQISNAHPGEHWYYFRQPSRRKGIPFASVTLEITANSSGLSATDAPPEGCLAATSFWPVDDEEFQSLARKITAGKSTNEAKVSAILRWLAPGQNLQYRGQTGSRWGTAKALKQGYGHCWDFSDCFVTLCRAAGVPARQVAGWLYGASGHVWAEYYVPNKGWQQVDPTGGGRLKCGIYHIAYFTTEDGEMPILYLAMPKIEALGK